VIAFGSNDEAVKAYESGRCDVFTTDVSGLYMPTFETFKSGDHAVLPEVISKERARGAPGDDQMVRSRQWCCLPIGRR